MPLTRPGAVRLSRLLQSSLLLGNCFLPGRYGRSQARLERDADGRASLTVEGGVSDELPSRMKHLKRQLRNSFRRLGAWLIPNSVKLLRPGEDMRYSGTLPMRETPSLGSVDRNGELFGASRLFIVDLSVFPTIPAKHHTLTLMANADRIGRIIAKRWKGTDSS